MHVEHISEDEIKAFLIVRSDYEREKKDGHKYIFKEFFVINFNFHINFSVVAFSKRLPRFALLDSSCSQGFPLVVCYR